MLKKRIIPCLDVKNGRVVKGINFLELRDAGDPVEVAKRYDLECADELVFLDITATIEGRGTVIDMVRSVAEQVFIPFTVGGGVNSVSFIRELLLAGADKVSINSPALVDPTIINESASRFGSQCIVVAIDAKRRLDEDGFDVYRNGGRINTGKDALDWALEAQSRGAGEILLTSMDADGTRDGFDMELTSLIASSLSIPVIASGGAGKMRHFKDVLTHGGASAALCASLFHYGELPIAELKKYLNAEGVCVRV